MPANSSHSPKDKSNWDNFSLSWSLLSSSINEKDQIRETSSYYQSEKRESIRKLYQYIQSVSKEQWLKLADEHYWDFSEFGHLVERTHKKFYNEKYNIKPAKIKAWCRYCCPSDQYEVVFKSWKEHKRTYKKFLCPSCKGKQNRQIALNRYSNETRQLLHTMPYKEYLKTEHWRMTRNLCLLIAKNKCQLCCSEEKLHVHHNTYDRRGYELLSDLIVLCKKCHEKFHDIESTNLEWRDEE